jgi:hypothetical protein
LTGDGQGRRLNAPEAGKETQMDIEIEYCGM